MLNIKPVSAVSNGEVIEQQESYHSNYHTSITNAEALMQHFLLLRIRTKSAFDPFEKGP